MQRVPLNAVIALAGQVLHAVEQACLAGDLDAKDVTAVTSTGSRPGLTTAQRAEGCI
jgi:hypothetical protein